MTTVAHLTAPAPFGGLESVVAGLARATAARGHRVVFVATLTPGVPLPGWAEALSADGVTVEVVRAKPRAYLAERRGVRELLQRHRVQVVHTHGYRSDVVHAGVARALGLPLVSTAHGFASTGGWGRIYEWLQIRAWRRFDAVVAVSYPLQATLARAGVPRDRLVMIRNGLVAGAPFLTRAEARARLGLPADVPVFGWVGRMSEEKDPLLSVESHALLRDRRALLCMIGEGPLRAACLDRAAVLGIAVRVLAPGPLPDAGTLLPAFDALVLSSRTEGTPMVLLEAAMAQVPIVATAVGGVPDLLGRDALLVPAGDAKALAAAMDAVLSDASGAATRARALHERLTRAGSEQDWVGQYLALYERVRALRR